MQRVGRKRGQVTSGGRGIARSAGFSHTAFTFAHESNVVQAPLDPNSVAPGSLIAILQKGLQFLELEANLDGQVGASQRPTHRAQHIAAHSQQCC